MKQKLLSATSARLVAVLAFAAVIAVALMGASASHAATPSLGGINVHPQLSGPERAPKPGDLFHCQSRPINGSQGPRCYTPQQIQQAYDYSGLLSSGVDGTGKTIVIVDAYSNPYIPNDLAIQDQTFGLPAPPSYRVVPVGRVPKFNIKDANQAGWAEEITLDVLWAHAMAPGANIVLVEGASANDSDLYAAEKYAVDNHLGDVMSQSFGEADTCVDPNYFQAWQDLYTQATKAGWTVFASSGDSGASQFNCAGTGAILASSWPASDPAVTGVGGTTLSATDPAGTYSGEDAWTEPLFGCNPPAVAAADINCSGGGFSTVFTRPAYQQSLVTGGTGRGVPDVAYDAGVNGGVITHCSVCNLLIGYKPSDLVFFIFGGTSAGSPQWAALTADADQMAGHDLGNINSSLYSIAAGGGPNALHDVIQGNNDVAEIGGQGYNAVQGWDPVTGLGSPDAAYLLPRLGN
jgi:subtilase family serine protease